MRRMIAVLLLTTAAYAQQHPRDKDIHDEDTRGWWHTTEALSGDSMEGRDTGSAAYQRAADYVAGRFHDAGLRAAGDNGTYFQSVPLHEVAIDGDGTSFTLLRDHGNELPIDFLQQITIAAAANLPSEAEAPLTFRGYCGKEAMKDIAGKIVVCFGTQRQGLPSGAERVANATEGEARGIINVDDPSFTIEPPRWPWAYARSVALGPAAPSSADGKGFLIMRLSAAIFPKFLEGTGQDATAILATGGRKEPLSSFDIPAKLRVQIGRAHV